MNCCDIYDLLSNVFFFFKKEERGMCMCVCLYTLHSERVNECGHMLTIGDKG